MVEKKTKSPQKTEMAKTHTDQDLHVVFSKRRTSSYKKASDMATLCDSHVAVIIESKNQKNYSFGDPDVQTVVDKYLSKNIEHAGITEQIIEANRAFRVQQFKEEFARLEMMNHEEKKRGQELEAPLIGEEHFIKPVEELDSQALQCKIKKVKELTKSSKEATSKHVLSTEANAFSSVHDP